MVGWQNLSPPPGRPDLLEPATVEVRGVVEGAPAQVFKRFEPPSVGGVADGAGGPHWQVNGKPHYAGAILDFWRPKPVPGDDGLPELLVGELHIVSDLLDSRRFSSLRMRLGFDADQEQGPEHPLPVDSTMLHINITKHPQGRQVTIVHECVPRWLIDDVRAFWQMVLEQNRSNDKFKAKMPWSFW